MEPQVLNQAREIFQTVRLLQERISRQFSQIQKAPAGEAVCTDLTMNQCHALMTVRELNVVSIKELARALHVSPPSASAMVDRLVELGVLVREQSRADRREVQVRLSALGEASASFMEEQFLSIIGDLLEKLGPDRSEQWTEVYSQIRGILLEEEQLVPPEAAK